MFAGCDAQESKSDADRVFEGQIREIMPYLNRLAFKLCGDRDHAEDLAQEALAKAWRARERFIPGTNFRAWLFTILRNEFCSEYRRAWRQVPWDQELAEKMMVSKDEQTSVAELKDVWRAMGKLPEAQRAAIILVCADGATYEEAASKSHCPVGTIKSRVVRARRALRNAIEGSAPERYRGLNVAALAAMNSARQRAASVAAAQP